MKSSQGYGRAREFPVFAMVALGILVSCAALWLAHESATDRAEAPLQNPAGEKQGFAVLTPQSGDGNAGGAAGAATGGDGGGREEGNPGKAGPPVKPGAKPVEPSRASVEIVRVSRRFSHFSVKVIDDASSSPVAGAVVTAQMTPNFADHEKTDAYGFVSLQMPDKFRSSIAVMAPGFEPLNQPFDYQGQGPREHVVRVSRALDQARHIEFFDAQSGAPVTAVEVQLAWLDRGALRRIYAESDPSGRVVLGGGTAPWTAAGAGRFRDAPRRRF